MKLAIGICTRNRPDSLRRLIKSLNSSKFKDLNLLVCDSSDESIRQEIISVIHGYELGGGIIYIKSTPGVAIQRNKLLEFARKSNCDTLYFLDDDVEVFEDYFTNINKIFKNYDQIAIVGAAISNIPKPIMRKRNQGKLQKNGIAHGVYSLKGNHLVDWVPCLSMSIRISLLPELYFDERREENSRGEDIAFCLSASSFTKILWTNSTFAIHHEESHGRYGSKKDIYANYVHRILLWKEFPDMVFRSRIITRIIFESITDMFRFIIRFNRLYLKNFYDRLTFLSKSRFCKEDIGEIIKMVREIPQ
jgi:glycosyltransferase involved in cell wall biosynthesis